MARKLDIGDFAHIPLGPTFFATSVLFTLASALLVAFLIWLYS